MAWTAVPIRKRLAAVIRTIPLLHQRTLLLSVELVAGQSGPTTEEDGSDSAPLAAEHRPSSTRRPPRQKGGLFLSPLLILHVLRGERVAHPPPRPQYLVLVGNQLL